MSIDETAERLIPLPPEQVAAYAMDWRHDHEWTQGIRKAELTREAEGGGFGPGAEVTRTAYFLGVGAPLAEGWGRIDYVLRVAEYEPLRLLDMVSVAGPIPMHVTYSFTPQAGGTLARIRVRGDASGYFRLAGPLMARQVRSSITKDLRDLELRLSRTD